MCLFLFIHCLGVECDTYLLQQLRSIHTEVTPVNLAMSLQVGNGTKNTLDLILSAVHFQQENVGQSDVHEANLYVCHCSHRFLII